MSIEKFSEIFDEKEFALNLTGKFGIPEIAEMLDFLKAEKVKTIETELKIGDIVYRCGYREYGRGEVVEVDVSIWDSGKPHIVYGVDTLGSGYDGEFEKA